MIVQKDERSKQFLFLKITTTCNIIITQNNTKTNIHQDYFLFKFFAFWFVKFFDFFIVFSSLTII